MEYKKLVKFKLILFISVMLWMGIVYLVAAILDHPNTAVIIAIAGFVIIPLIVLSILREEIKNFRR